MSMIVQQNWETMNGRKKQDNVYIEQFDNIYQNFKCIQTVSCPGGKEMLQRTLLDKTEMWTVDQTQVL